MIKTPIVFSFNDSFTVPAGVCITSLLENANAETFYEIFILHSSLRLSEDSKNQILRLTEHYSNCSFNFIDLKDKFSGCFEIRDISVDAYYRLAIPFEINQYDKVIYADVDIVFNKDLSHLSSIDLQENCIAAVKIPSINIAPFIPHMSKYGVEAEHYFNSGFLVFDLKKIRQDKTFKESVDKLIAYNFVYQDQDILNILFKDKTFFLDKTYNYTINWLKQDKNQALPKIVHYTGNKPWNSIRSFGELWWEYYRKSPYYDEAEYLKFQQRNYIDLYNNNKIITVLERYGITTILKRLMKNK